MSKIRVLPDSVANKIAAGEVVERPASVVKELVENSMDAGALSIRVSVEAAGSKLVSVSDDGEGMDQDDALLCLEAHATSKIYTDDDIDGIRSFGFRGEALPSIASVSKLSLRTRRRESLEGVEVVIHGGKMLSNSPAGCAPGTEIAVRELFFNTPARRKFLRSPATEERHIVETVSLISLAHPLISFELSVDGRKALSSPACEDLSPRIKAIFGRELAEALVPVSWTESGVSVSGYVARRGYAKPSRQDQKVFVNGRPIESLPVYRGIKEGCGPTLDKGRHQPCILFLSMDPRLVDVNVHPAKKEVRFRREFEIVSAVRNAIASALKSSSEAMAGFSPSQEPSPLSLEDAEPWSRKPCAAPSSFQAPREASRSLESLGQPQPPSLERTMKAALVEYVPSAASVLMKMKKASELLPGGLRQDSLIPDEAPKASSFASQSDSFKIGQVEAPPQEAQPFPGSTGLRVLGFVDDSYIVASIPGGLVLIDQHAAHERILFEKLLKGVDGSLSQRLLIPINVEVSRSDFSFVSKNAEAFKALGFEVEPFGQSSFKLNAIPAALEQSNAGGMFKELVSCLVEDGESGLRTDSAKIALAACKAAVKSHDKLSMDEAASLIKQMARCEQPFSCPHGRPTVINISVKELERRFGRK